MTWAELEVWYVILVKVTPISWWARCQFYRTLQRPCTTKGKAELVADQSNSLLLECIKHLHTKDYFCFSIRGARVWYNTDLTVVTSCCVHDCTNCVKNGSVGTKAICSEYLSFGSRDAILSLKVDIPYIFHSFAHQGRRGW